MKLQLKKSLLRVGNDVLSLIYPKVCLACGGNTQAHENTICGNCQYKMPQTGFHKVRNNPLIRRFWGRVNLDAGSAFYYFGKGGKVQQLIHNLKYNNQPEIGLQLGNLYGNVLEKSAEANQIDLIIPVPLHPQKEKIRGYNQSAAFAQGISETLNLPWIEGLKRIQMTVSQTRKDRIERYQNVSEAFEVADSEALRDKHILLVDDVITTGATIEACSHQILGVPGTKVSVASIAFARQG